MKKVLLVLSVAALTLTSCSKEDTDCNCGTVLSQYSVSNGYRVRVVSDCETDPRAHWGEIDSPEWTFSEFVGYENIEEGETYCALEPQF